MESRRRLIWREDAAEQSRRLTPIQTTQDWQTSSFKVASVHQYCTFPWPLRMPFLYSSPSLCFSLCSSVWDLVAKWWTAGRRIECRRFYLFLLSARRCASLCPTVVSEKKNGKKITIATTLPYAPPHTTAPPFGLGNLQSSSGGSLSTTLFTGVPKLAISADPLLATWCWMHARLLPIHRFNNSDAFKSYQLNF